jgi:predicted esterase
MAVSKWTKQRNSPYENISKDAAPLYLVHGTADGVVDPVNSRDLKVRYEEVGASVELDWIEGRGHDFYEGSDLGIALAAKWFRKTFDK